MIFITLSNLNYPNSFILSSCIKFPRPSPVGTHFSDVSFYIGSCLVVILMIQARNTHQTQLQKQLCQSNPRGGGEVGLRNLKRGLPKVREVLLQEVMLRTDQAVTEITKQTY